MNGNLLPVYHKNRCCDRFFFEGKILIGNWDLDFTHRSDYQYLVVALENKRLRASSFLKQLLKSWDEIASQVQQMLFPRQSFPIRKFEGRGDYFSTQFFGGGATLLIDSEIWRSNLFLYCWCLWEVISAATLMSNFPSYASNFGFGDTDLETIVQSLNFYSCLITQKATLYYFFFFGPIWIGKN